jgi:hypothetical protein
MTDVIFHQADTATEAIVLEGDDLVVVEAGTADTIVNIYDRDDPVIVTAAEQGPPGPPGPVGSIASATDLTINGQLRIPTLGAAAGVLIGGDTNLYRQAADLLRTPDNLQVDGYVDLGAAAWTGLGATNILSAPRLIQPGGYGPALKTRFLRNATHDANHRRVSAAYIVQDTVNWSYGLGLEIVTRTDYYGGGSLTRCAIGGAYSTNHWLRVIESHGPQPIVPKLGTIYPVNIVPNPSFETDLSGWTNGNTPYETAIRQTSWFKHGVASARLTKSVGYASGSNQSGFSTPMMSLASLGYAVGDTVGIAAEVNVYAATGTPYVQARCGFFDAGGGYLGAATASVAPGGQAVVLGTRRVTGSSVIPAGTTQLQIDLLAGGSAGATLDIAYDSVVVAKGGIPSSFIPTTFKEVEIYFELPQYVGITAEFRYGGYTEVSRPFVNSGTIAWTGAETTLAADPGYYNTSHIDVSNGIRFSAPGVNGASADTNLYRAGADLLKTDDSLQVGGVGGIYAIDGGLDVQRATLALTTIRSRVTNDLDFRFLAQADGKLLWGDGATSGARDTNLYRVSASVLKTDGQFVAGGNISMSATAAFIQRNAASAATPIFVCKPAAQAVDNFAINANGTLSWGDGINPVDTQLYRASADVLKTDDTLVVGTVIVYPTVFGVLHTTAATNHLLRNYLAGGDANAIFRIAGDGRHEWGAGGAGALDTNLYRTGVGVLGVGNVLQFPTAVTAASVPNNSIFRDSADNVIKKKDNAGAVTAI